MRVLFAGNKERGLECLRAVVEAGHDVVAVVAHPPARASGGLAAEAHKLGVPLFEPDDVNDEGVVDSLRALTPDVVALAGYGQILRRPLLDVARLGCVNLHGGKLPEDRGSSPMNRALLRGDSEVTLSATLVDEGVDTGSVLDERRIEVGPDETIAEVQARANVIFPELLVTALEALEQGTVAPRPQDEARAAYFPLRFPDDGLVVWEHERADEIHNKIRALTTPYPGAFTFLGRRKVLLLRSRRAEQTVHGEPGRVYAVGSEGLLTCARDKCLWIVEARFDDGTDAVESVRRYDSFATARTRLIEGLE